MLKINGGGNELLCALGYLIVNFRFKSFLIVAYTVKQRDTHSDGTDIKVFLLYHINGFKNILGIYHCITSLNTVHSVKNILVHKADIKPLLCANCRK